MFEDQLKKVFGVEKYDFERKCWFYSTRTPMHGFTGFFLEILDSTRVAFISIRDRFEKKDLEDFLSFLISREAEFLEVPSFKKLKGFEKNNPGFQSAILLGSACHTYSAKEKSLHDKIIAAFPIFDCEFSGTETVSEMETMRNRIVVTIDWKRSPTPKVLFRYNNSEMQSGTIGRKFVFTTLEMVQFQTGNLPKCPESYVQIKNFKDEVCRIYRTDAGFSVEFRVSIIRLMPGSDLINDFLKRFFFVGLP